MKWRWLAVFLIGLLVVAGGLYLILDPEIHEVNEAARTKWGGTYIRLSDGFTHYQLKGPPGAKVAVLVHGANVPMWNWDRQVQALTAAGFRVLSYPEAEKYTRLFMEQTTYKGFQQSMISMLRNDAVGDYRDAYQIVGQQNREVLLIRGTEDTEITRQMIREIQAFIPRLTFKLVEGAGHVPMFQKPQIVNQLIINFFLN